MHFPVGAFESDALLVPQHCYFDHEHQKPCEAYQYWNETATRKCGEKNMVTESFAMLLACGIDRFNGVEYVCCPPEASKSEFFLIVWERSCIYHCHIVIVFSLAETCPNDLNRTVR